VAKRRRSEAASPTQGVTKFGAQPAKPLKLGKKLRVRPIAGPIRGRGSPPWVVAGHAYEAAGEGCRFVPKVGGCTIMAVLLRENIVSEPTNSATPTQGDESFAIKDDEAANVVDAEQEPALVPTGRERLQIAAGRKCVKLAKRLGKEPPDILRTHIFKWSCAAASRCPHA
jgi:hypothetical protein